MKPQQYLLTQYPRDSKQLCKTYCHAEMKHFSFDQ